MLAKLSAVTTFAKPVLLRLAPAKPVLVTMTRGAYLLLMGLMVASYAATLVRNSATVKAPEPVQKPGVIRYMLS
jgi:hypothetical protein